jgi:tripartite ATP-independent transporter DctM subunit
MIGLLFSVFFAFLVLGVPVAFAIGLASLVGILWDGRIPLTLIPARVFAGMDSFPLMAIPFFILTGELANQSGLTERIIRLANLLIGRRIRAGLAHVNITASMLFSGVSGSVVADSSAMGSILIPAMVKCGFDRDYAVAVTATSSTIGALVPPSILMVLYGFLANVSIGQLFLGGLVPGLMVGFALMLVAHIVAVRRGYGVMALPDQDDGPGALLRAVADAAIALIVPLVIIVGIVGGLFTPTEAGVIAVACVLAAGLVLYRTLDLRKLETALVDAAVTTTIVMMILGMTSVFANLLARARFQSQLLTLLGTVAQDPTLQLLVIMAMLFVLGFVIDTTALIILFAPPLAMIGLQLGFDPVHFGVVIVMIALIGAVTPPVGTLLFLGCGIARIPLVAVLGVIWPFIAALLSINLLIVFVPELVLFLPRLLFR